MHAALLDSPVVRVVVLRGQLRHVVTLLAGPPRDQNPSQHLSQAGPPYPGLQPEAAAAAAAAGRRLLQVQVTASGAEQPRCRTTGAAVTVDAWDVARSHIQYK
jgi:hypothetical protein